MELQLISHQDKLVRVAVSGIINQDTTSRDNEPLEALIGLETYNHTVMLNMTDTDLIDSSGIGWLLNCHKRFGDGGGRLIIHSLPPIVANVFKLMRLETVFSMSDNEETAERLAQEN
ncbi:MAG: hypothetical protein COA78_02855 [Blastopirellula sp.]|nr:MAG: hypothetical protein COA78_02855 [Blastopirellula sp.]